MHLLNCKNKFDKSDENGVLVFCKVNIKYTTVNSSVKTKVGRLNT